jgi:tRNA modification GTPase
MKHQYQDTIIALATPAGSGAIGVIRLSGPDAITMANRFFEGKFKTKDLTKVSSHTIHLGYLKDDDKIIDEVLVSISVITNLLGAKLSSPLSKLCPAIYPKMEAIS